MDWHETFKKWSKPPSEHEESKASAAADLIRDAVRDTKLLAARNFKVYPTGSYRNNTNVKLDSDIDVAIALSDAFFYKLPANMPPSVFGLGNPATYGLDEFRRDVGRALETAFGAAVTRGTKTFRIAGTATRLPADATPFLVHRTYTGRLNLDGSWEYHEGVELRPTDAPHRSIVNWHDDHYEQGVARNNATGRRFKRVARILKKLREHMKDHGTSEARAAAASAASFLIECLAYNAPDVCYNREEGSYYKDVRDVIAHCHGKTDTDVSCAELLEVSRRKLLFGAHQGWTRQQAREFLLRAWQHVGFR